MEREFRFELFLNGELPNRGPSPDEFRAALDRVVAQQLLLDEMPSSSGQTSETSQTSEGPLEGIRAKFPAEQDYRKALDLLQMDEQQIRRKLRLDELILARINERFGPQASVNEVEISAYYRDVFAREYRRRHGGAPPPLAEVRDQIRQVLTQKRINQLLAAWLKELKAGRHVQIFTDGDPGRKD